MRDNTVSSSTMRSRLFYSKMTPEEITTYNKARNDKARAKRRERELSSSALSPPERLVHQVKYLGEELQRIIAAFDLDEADLLSPSRSKALQIQCQNLVETGNLDGYRQFKGLNKSNQPALFLIDSLLGRYSDAEKDARPNFPPLLVTVLESQGTLRAIRDALLSENNIVQTAFDTWRRTAVQVMSKIVDEHIGTLPPDWKLSYLNVHDIQRLRVSCWLNDNLMEYLLEKSPHLEPLTTLCLSPLFFTKYLRFGKHEASKAQWMRAWSWKNSQITNCAATVQKVLLPVSLNDQHWVLLYADLKNRSINVLDSLKQTRKKELDWEKSTHGDLIKSMLLLLSKIHEKFGTESTNDANEFHMQPHYKVPLQGNNDDCGVYALMFARHLITGPGINHAGVPPGLHISNESLNPMFLRLNFLEEITPI